MECVQSRHNGVSACLPCQWKLLLLLLYDLPFPCWDHVVGTYAPLVWPSMRGRSSFSSHLCVWKVVNQEMGDVYSWCEPHLLTCSQTASSRKYVSCHFAGISLATRGRMPTVCAQYPALNLCAGAGNGSSCWLHTPCFRWRPPSC